MKQNSILREIYTNQKQSVNKQSEKISQQQHSNNLHLLKWMLVGALTSSIILAPFIILYIRKQNKVTTDSTTTILTTVTTTAISLRWNSTGMIVAGFGSLGTNASQLNNPYGLALDSYNSLYIVDRQNNRVQKYLSGASSGTTVAGQASGVAGTGSTYLNQPGYIVLDSNNNIYVTDSANNRVQFWSNGASSGITIAGTGTMGNASNQFNTPRGIARDSNSGALYIADQYNHRIMYYVSGATSGTVAAGGNGCGSSSSQLCEPVGVQFDSTSNSLFISNYDSQTVVHWALGATAWTLISGSLNIIGSSSTLLNGPTGFVLDSMKNVYLADTYNDRIILFMAGQTNGTTIAGSTATPGSNLSLLNSPFWVSLDTQLNLYVSDRNNQRVLKFIRY